MTIVNRQPAFGPIFPLPVAVHIGHTIAQRPENALSGQQDPARNPVRLDKLDVLQQRVRVLIRPPLVQAR